MEGLTCNALIDAKGFTISSITVSDYSTRPDGSDWDAPDTNPNPDIFLEIIDLSDGCSIGCNLVFRSDIVDNATDVTTFDVSNEPIFISLEGDYSIDLYDMDKTGEEYIGSEIIIGTILLNDLKNEIYSAKVNIDLLTFMDIEVAFDVTYQF